MKLKFNRETELWVVGFGVHKPGKIKEVKDELGKRMLETGYFDEIKERKRKVKIKSNLTWGNIKGKSKPFKDISKKLEVKKSK